MKGKDFKKSRRRADANILQGIKKKNTKKSKAIRILQKDADRVREFLELLKLHNEGAPLQNFNAWLQTRGLNPVARVTGDVQVMNIRGKWMQGESAYVLDSDGNVIACAFGIKDRVTKLDNPYPHGLYAVDKKGKLLDKFCPTQEQLDSWTNSDCPFTNVINYSEGPDILRFFSSEDRCRLRGASRSFRERVNAWEEAYFSDKVRELGKPIHPHLSGEPSAIIYRLMTFCTDSKLPPLPSTRKGAIWALGLIAGRLHKKGFGLRLIENTFIGGMWADLRILDEAINCDIRISIPRDKHIRDIGKYKITNYSAVIGWWSVRVILGQVDSNDDSSDDDSSDDDSSDDHSRKDEYTDDCCSDPQCDRCYC